MSDFSTNIQKFGNIDQLKALEQLGKAGKADKLATSYDASVFQGDYENFANSALGTVYKDSELKALFSLLNTDGDNVISESEIKALSSLGSKGSADKIDNNDLKVLFKDSKAYADRVASEGTSSASGQGKKEVKVDEKTGIKTVQVKGEDGSVKVVKYNKDGQKISQTVTDESGQISRTKYTYDKDGQIISSKTGITRKDEDGKTYTVKTKETTYKDGKRNVCEEKDADGNVLSTSKYSYANNGKLSKAVKKNADNTVVSSEYNTTTGKISGKTKLNAEGRVESKTDYNADGVKSYKTAYTYDENGHRNTTRNYSYNYKGEVISRDKYDQSGALVLKSTYFKNEDGSMLRTDRDPLTGKATGSKLFTYNDYGQNTMVSALDANGANETARVVKNYNEAGVLESSDKYRYSQDDDKYTRTVLSDEGNDGKIDSASYFQDDESGKTLTASFDLNYDGKIDEQLKFEYDENGQMIGRYTDENNDGVYDTYDAFKNNEIVSSTKVKKSYV